MVMPLLEEGANEAILKTISSRVAGGRRMLNKEPSRASVLFLVSQTYSKVTF